MTSLFTPTTSGICQTCLPNIAAKPHMYDLESGLLNPSNCGAQPCFECDALSCELLTFDHNDQDYCLDCVPVCRCSSCDPDWHR